MKSYTDLEQSKKLTEILPLESADMCFNTRNNMPPLMTPYSKFNEFFGMEKTPDFLIPCWSLAALINNLPDTITDEDGAIFGLNIKKNFVEYYNPSMGALYATYHSIIAEDLVDACYEMIIHLHELKML